MSDEPVSPTDLKDALVDTNHNLAELRRDMVKARAEGDERKAKRLLELILHYMQKKWNYKSQLGLFRRSRR